MEGGRNRLDQFPLCWEGYILFPIEADDVVGKRRWLLYLDWIWGEIYMVAWVSHRRKSHCLRLSGSCCARHSGTCWECVSILFTNTFLTNCMWQIIVHACLSCFQRQFICLTICSMHESLNSPVSNGMFEFNHSLVCLKAYSIAEKRVYWFVCARGCMCASSLLTQDILYGKMHRAANHMPMVGAGQTPAAIDKLAKSCHEYHAFHLQ